MEEAVGGVRGGFIFGSSDVGQEGPGGAAGQAQPADRADEGGVGLAAKKALVESSLDRKRMLIDMRHPRLSVLRQCDLIGLPRSSLYYRAQGEDAYGRQLMRLIDHHYPHL